MKDRVVVKVTLLQAFANPGGPSRVPRYVDVGSLLESKGVCFAWCVTARQAAALEDAGFGVRSLG